MPNLSIQKAPFQDAELLDFYSKTIVFALELLSPAVVYIVATSYRGRGRRETRGSSGFIFKPDRSIFTESHVVRGAKEIKVSNINDQPINSVFYLQRLMLTVKSDTKSMLIVIRHSELISLLIKPVLK